jgi:phage repressor protein C with HTH and peptisase S24 domain
MSVAAAAIEWRLSECDNRKMDNRWIGDRLKALRKTKSGLAKALGIDPARVSEIIGGRRNVQVAELPVMAATLEMPTEELVGRLVSRRQARRAADDDDGNGFHPGDGAATDGFAPQPLEVPVRGALARDLPVYGAAVGGEDGSFEMNGQVVDFAERPPSLSGARNAYGIYVQGESMSPRFEAGWLVLVNPSRPVRKGDNVVVQLKGADEHAAPRGFVKVFETRTPQLLVVRQFNPPRTLEWPVADVISVHRVISVAEM